MRAAPQRWLFSRAWDLGLFGGSALAALTLVAVGYATGAARAPFPPWAWVATVLFVDVAHVWATLFRVYLDPAEVRRRRGLYLAAPALCYAAGVGLYALGPRAFWSVLAYLAVFHFVRQQYGWVALYKRRNADHDRVDSVLDPAAIYAATVYPLVWWHAHLPRAFAWLLPGDFLAAVPVRVAAVLHPAYITVMGAWAARQVYLYATRRWVNAGKVLVVATTATCWYVGIVATDSDYVFTVTNVVLHGVPYFGLVWRYASRRYGPGARAAVITPRVVLAARVVARGVAAFLLVALACAFVEEALWDQLVWHERRYLFGELYLRPSDALLGLLVPALALPQAAHYVLDGFIWRAGPGNPTLLRDLGLAPA